MGGKEGAWGYLAQAVVAVINSLSDDSWTHVQIEPDTENDKVDIAWYYEKKNLVAVQVKSSKNNFSLPDVFSWLETLIKDVKDASLYRLILIGTCSDTTKKTFNKINEKKATSDDWKGNELLQENTEKIAIQLENNDHEALESKIMRYLGHFLSTHQKYPSHLTLELMSNALGYQFMRFSTNGEKISKEEFEIQLLEWVEYNHMLEGRVQKSDLKIQYYLSDVIPFSTNLNALQSDLLHSEIIKTKKQEAMDLVRKINDINISKKVREEPEEVEIYGRSMKLSLQTYSEITGQQREEYKKLSEKILGIQLSDGFFYVGNLKEPSFRVKGMYSSPPVQRIGDDIEKEKFKLILDLESKLENLDSIIRMFMYLDSCYIVPLVIRNIGTKYDEKIRVKIIVPGNLNFLNASQFEQPDFNIIDKFIGFNGILHNEYTHRKDSQIKAYNYVQSRKPVIPTAFLDAKEQVKIVEEKFKTYLKALFDFEVYEEGENLVFILHFGEINPKEAIAFPCFLLCQVNHSFSLNYEITSKNSSEISSGELLYKIAD